MLNISYEDIKALRSVEDLYLLLDKHDMLYLGEPILAIIILVLIIIFAIFFAAFIAKKIGKRLARKDENKIEQVKDFLVNNKDNIPGASEEIINKLVLSLDRMKKE